MSERDHRCISETCPVRETCARFKAPHGPLESDPLFDYWHDDHEHAGECKYFKQWPLVNEGQVETALDRLLVMFEQKADSDDACEDWCACDHFCWRGGWCVFSSDASYEQLIGELKTAIKEQG